MKADTILDKILHFLYFAGIFLILYWICILLFDKLIPIEAKLRWEEEMGILWPSLRSRGYYLSPLISFMIASVFSGAVYAAYRDKLLLWFSIPIFIAVFWFIESLILCRESSFWDFYPTREHELIAPAFAVVCTVLIVRKTTGFLCRLLRQERKFYCKWCDAELSPEERRDYVDICPTCVECMCIF